MIAFLGTMALSRVYLGAHTYNEVLYGALIGTTMAGICHFKIKSLVLKIPEMLYSKD